MTYVGLLKLVEGYFFYNLREALATFLAAGRTEETTDTRSHPTTAGGSSLRKKLNTGPQCWTRKSQGLHDFPELPFFPLDFQNSELVESVVFNHHVKSKKKTISRNVFFSSFYFYPDFGFVYLFIEICFLVCSI